MEIKSRLILIVYLSCDRARSLGSSANFLLYLGISFIGRLFPLLTSFDCSHCPQVTDIYPIVFGCQHLKVLTVDGCPISVSDSSEVQDNWAKFPNSLRFLRKFKFSGTGVLEASFNEWFGRFEQ
jgi:hypothetical protein